MGLLPYLLLLALAAWVSSRPRGPYESLTELERNTHLAEQLTRHAADRIDAMDLDAAEDLLRQALSADLFHGPAHNNLGVVFLQQGKLYEAAQEFEWAKKLLPSAPDPRVNLALTLERAGDEDQATLAWDAALEVAPRCREAQEGRERLAWLQGGVGNRPIE